MNKDCVVGKIVANGKLKLLSPLLIGNGSQNEHDVYEIDTPVMADKDGIPFIPATSLAGALRDIVWNIEDENDKLGTAYIFGTDSDINKRIKRKEIKEQEQQSMISIYDVKLNDAKISYRDGVTIESITGVAKRNHKYDFEVVERGAKGDFYIEITLREYHKDDKRSQRIDKLLNNLWPILCNGFSLGAMTSKGLGRVCIENLTVDTYDFKNNKNDIMAWLDPDGKTEPVSRKIFNRNKDDIKYPKENFVIEANFTINGSLIVKDSSIEGISSEIGDNVKAVMKRSRNDFLIPGSSIKGVLRHRAEYIADLLGLSYDTIYSLMGYPSEIKDEEGKEIKLRSRLFVSEVYIDPVKVKTYNQSRIRIDRFTGGTIEGALFTEQPITALDDEAPIKIRMEIRSAKDYEIGLLICLLRDLWLGRISIGGDKAIGRGRLNGVSATIWYGMDSNNGTWQMNEYGKIINNVEQPLQKYVEALHDFAKGVKASED